VCYKNILRPATKKRPAHIDKLPVNPRTGTLADTTDAQTWSTYEEAIAGLTRWPVHGLGFVFTKACKVVGCDLDNAGNVRTGRLDTLAQETITALDTYAEWSPSGTGIHLLASGGPLPPEGRHVVTKDGHKVEMYDSDRFFTITGLHVSGTPFEVAHRPEAIRAFHAGAFGTAAYTAEAVNTEAAQDTPAPPETEDTALLDKMFQSTNGKRIRHLWDSGAPANGDTTASGGDFALCCELAWWTGGNAAHMERLFRQSPRMEAAEQKKPAYLSRTIKKAIAAWRQDRPPDPTEPPTMPYETGIAETPAGDAAITPVASIADVEAVVREWLLLPALDVVRLLCATVLVNLAETDPLWLFVVGPPSTGKTELLRALSGLPDIYRLSSLTAQTLVSGYRDHRAPDLLPKLTGKVVVLKDFTTVLTMHRESRQEILAQLREIYDGEYTKGFGTGKVFSWRGKIGFIAGVTGVIDTYYAVYQVLGERFIQYRLPLVGRREQARFALRNAGKETVMRKALQDVFTAFFTGRTFPALQTIEVPDATGDDLVTLACLASVARSGIMRESYHTREIELAPDPEAPARLVKQLKALACALALVDARTTVTPADMAPVATIALNCLPKLRYQVLSALYANATDTTLAPDLSTTDIAERIGYPTNTTRRILEELTALRLTRKRPGGEGKADRWRLAATTKRHLETAFRVAGTLPEKSGGSTDEDDDEADADA
jgi:hypothetical protein